MIDKNILEYRKKHRSCKWCKYYEYVTPPYLGDPQYKNCQLKDKIIHCNSAHFCKYYLLKDLST